MPVSRSSRLSTTAIPNAIAATASPRRPDRHRLQPIAGTAIANAASDTSDARMCSRVVSASKLVMSAGNTPAAANAIPETAIKQGGDTCAPPAAKCPTPGSQLGLRRHRIQRCSRPAREVRQRHPAHSRLWSDGYSPIAPPQTPGAPLETRPVQAVRRWREVAVGSCNFIRSWIANLGGNLGVCATSLLVAVWA